MRKKKPVDREVEDEALALALTLARRRHSIVSFVMRSYSPDRAEAWAYEASWMMRKYGDRTELGGELALCPSSN